MPYLLILLAITHSDDVVRGYICFILVINITLQGKIFIYVINKQTYLSYDIGCTCVMQTTQVANDYTCVNKLIYTIVSNSNYFVLTQRPNKLLNVAGMYVL